MMPHGGATASLREKVRADFDTIALALGREPRRDVLSPCESRLVGMLPERCDAVLEVGCGDGRVTRRLAQRARSVLALDLSPEMIRLARTRSSGVTNVEYQVADLLATSLPPVAFDAVIAFTVLHHLPVTETLSVLTRALRPGGMLLVQDLVDRSARRYLPLNAAAVLLQLARSARGIGKGQSWNVTRLYRRHGRGERYLTPREVEQVYGFALPDARVMHHAEWRYSVIWIAR